MKRILTFIAIAVIGISAFTGCQKYEFSPSMSATIDTMSFTASGKSNVSAHIDSVGTLHSLIINGYSDVFTPGTAVKPTIVLTVPNAVGDYTIDTNNNTRNAMIYTARSGSVGTRAVSGIVKVFGLDGGNVSGSFSFTCADGTVVTNGKFIAHRY
jgi:hypothetical protein